MVAHVFEAERALGRVHALILEKHRKTSKVMKAKFVRQILKSAEAVFVLRLERV